MALRRRIRSRLRNLVERFSGEYSAASEHLEEEHTPSTPASSGYHPVRARLIRPRANPDEDPREGR
ncbi:MAG: hypothetical protein JXB39_10470 [Deltaproteobacteria bacterium]|nr:hypothetical protein [Deltaproteobacteria bacterium]